MRRIMLDISQPVLADITGISLSSVRKYEQGQISVHLPRLLEICEALDCQLAIVPLEHQTPEFKELVSDTLAEEIDFNRIARNRRKAGGARDAHLIPKLFKATGKGRGTDVPKKK
jgi:transcriptional regulator with XRE-family HTH domain